MIALKIFLYAMLMIPAVWRASNMILYEDGPYDIFRNLRKKFSAGEFSKENPDPEKMTEKEVLEFMWTSNTHPLFTPLLSCFWCLSMWVSFVLAIPLSSLLYTENMVGTIAAIVIVALSGSAGAIWIEENTEG